MTQNSAGRDSALFFLRSVTRNGKKTRLNTGKYIFYPKISHSDRVNLGLTDLCKMI